MLFRSALILAYDSRQIFGRPYADVIHVREYESISIRNSGRRKCRSVPPPNGTALAPTAARASVNVVGRSTEPAGAGSTIAVEMALGELTETVSVEAAAPLVPVLHATGGRSGRRRSIETPPPNDDASYRVNAGPISSGKKLTVDSGQLTVRKKPFGRGFSLWF